MSSFSSYYRLPIILAVTLHVVILILFLFSLEFSSQKISLPGTNVQVINAFAINTSALNEKLAHTKTTKKIEQKPPKPIEPKPPVEHQITEKPSKPQQEKIKPLLVKEKTPPPIKKSSPIPVKHELTKPTVKKTYNVSEKNKITPPNETKSLQTNKKTTEKAKEKPQQNDDIAKRKKALEAEMAKEIAQQDKAQEMKDLLAQDMKANQQQTQAAQSKFEAGIIDKYKALIKSAIEQHWNIPDGANKDLTCDLLITLAPGGAVLNVIVVKSSGMDALDRSAVQAVYQASPLPIPNDTSLFDNFRQLSLTVKPETVVDS